jgi:hypothetical protein
MLNIFLGSATFVTGLIVVTKLPPEQRRRVAKFGAIAFVAVSVAAFGIILSVS